MEYNNKRTDVTEISSVWLKIRLTTNTSLLDEVLIYRTSYLIVQNPLGLIVNFMKRITTLFFPFAFSQHWDGSKESTFIFSIMNKITLLLAMAFCFSFSSLAQTTYYVDAARPNDTGAGTSWATAKKDLQIAMNIATAGDQIWVKAGTYLPWNNGFHLCD